MADTHPPGLSWSTPSVPNGDGMVLYTLNPDHPNHDRNMAEMTRLQRRILRAHLETVLETLDEAERANG